MLSYVKAPKVFWGEALLTTHYLQNKSSTKVVITNITLYGLWFENNQIHLTLQSLGVKHMFLFTRRKDTNWIHSHECIFLGYNKESKAYCLMYTHDKKTIISKDVIFNKSFATHQEDQYLQKMIEEENGTSLQSNFFSKTPNIQGQPTFPSQNASNG
jgi:hypothetical protein